MKEEIGVYIGTLPEQKKEELEDLPHQEFISIDDLLQTKPGESVESSTDIVRTTPQALLETVGYDLDTIGQEANHDYLKRRIEHNKKFSKTDLYIAQCFKQTKNAGNLYKSALNATNALLQTYKASEKQKVIGEKVLNYILRP